MREKIKKGRNKKKKVKVRIGPSRIMDLVLRVPPSLPKVFLMRSYARVVHMPRLDGGMMEVELLVQLWMDRAVVLQGRPDSFDSVRGLDGRRSVRLDEAALHLSRKGRGMLLSTEGALHVFIDCDRSARSGHLKL